MAEGNQENIFNAEIEQNSSFDFKAEFFKILGYWKLFAAAVILAWVLAFLYLRYATPLYQVSCTVLIKDDSKSRYASTSIINELDVFKQQSNLQNEIGIIQSKTLSRQTVKEQGLYITYYYYTNKLNRKIEIFDDCPFKVLIDTSHIQLINAPVILKFNSDENINIKVNDFENASAYNFSAIKNDSLSFASRTALDATIKMGEEFKNSAFSFRIIKNPAYSGGIDDTKNYYFIISDPLTVGEAYASTISTEQINKDASIIKITTTSALPSKSIHFLNALAENYISINLEYKNLTATKTINFIDEQLGSITDSLHNVEDILENFRTQNKTMDLSSEYQAILTKLQAQDDEKVKVNLEIKYYDYILNYLQAKSEYADIISPSFMGLSNETLSTLVTDLMTLSTEKNKLAISSTENNPYLANIEASIITTKKALIEQINNSLGLAKISLIDINKRIAESEAAINKLPGTEKDLLTIQRKFDINDETYSFLLEKKAEASISKASNLSNNMILDPAELEAKVSPNNKKIYMVALILGLLIPFAFIKLREYFNDSIQDKEEIESRSSLPIIGAIAHSRYSTNTIVIENPRSMVSETIRSVKANLDFLSTAKSKIITLTSTVGGEGKTFCSMNLASAYAISDMRTLLIGADLRRPKITKDFNLQNDKGLSNLLIGKGILDDVINKTTVANLDIITAGPVPPNPAELLGSERMKAILEELKVRYDYIIIDTPPLGIVTDALFLMRLADINIYVTRFDYTSKKVIKEVNDLVKTTGVKNVCFLLNDVLYKRTRYGKYGRYSNKYGYAYTYSEGYYED